MRRAAKSSQLYLTITITTTTPNHETKMYSNVHNQKDKKKWATFTYAGKYVDHITKFFHKQDLGVVFQTKSKIGRFLNRNVD